MGIFDNIFNFNKRESSNETRDEVGKFSVPRSTYNGGVELEIRENKSDQIYSFGIRNDFPEQLIKLYDLSPTNQAVINRTSLMIAGGDVEIVGDPDDIFNMIHAIALKKFPNQKQNLEQIVQQLAFDCKLHGRFGIECLWNETHDKVVSIKRIDASGIRVGLTEDDVVKKLWYSEDWTDKKCPRIEFQPFDKYGDQPRQMLYVQMMRSGHSVYGLPDYYASMNWITLESEIGTHYLDSAQNGFSPKMSVVFPAKPESEEIEDRIMKRLNDRYTGSRGKKIIGIFASRPELKPEFNPINTENLDKQYSVIDEQTQNKILTGHGVVSPMLFGIKTAGQLGGANELETAFSIYQSTVVKPYQDLIERALNEILDASDNPMKFKLSEFEIMTQQAIETDDQETNRVADALNSMSPLVATKVLEKMTPNEIRSLGGLDSIDGGDRITLSKNTDENESDH